MTMIMIMVITIIITTNIITSMDPSAAAGMITSIPPFICGRPFWARCLC